MHTHIHINTKLTLEQVSHTAVCHFVFYRDVDLIHSFSTNYYLKKKNDRNAAFNHAFCPDSNTGVLRHTFLKLNCFNLTRCLQNEALMMQDTEKTRNNMLKSLKDVRLALFGNSAIYSFLKMLFDSYSHLPH